VAVSRVGLGVHRLSDVFAGLGVGLLIGTAALVVTRWWLKLSDRTRLRWLPVGPAFATLALLLGPTGLHAAAASAGGLVVGACLPPLYRLRNLRRDFSGRRLLVRAGIAAIGTAVLVIGYVGLGPAGKLAVASLFGLWITGLAPAAFRAAGAD
jgi:O-antigen/teichoic acid export membrane protein